MKGSLTLTLVLLLCASALPSVAREGDRMALLPQKRSWQNCGLYFSEMAGGTIIYFKDAGNPSFVRTGSMQVLMDRKSIRLDNTAHTPYVVEENGRDVIHMSRADLALATCLSK